MTSTTYDHSGAYRTGASAKTTGIGDAILNWLGRVAERSGRARQAEMFGRLNALSDDELARMGLRRNELIQRCFGARALY